jgi:hypothetical protein
LVATGKLSRAQVLVLIELCHVHFRKRINPVPLTNKNLARMGVNRHAKMRALKALKDKGIVRFECNGKRGVEVLLVWQLPKQNSGWEHASV